MYPPVTSCIFDMDGVLLDTERIYTRITQKIVGRYGKTFDWSVKGNMIGRPMMDSARYLVETLDLPITAEAYIEMRTELAPAEFPKCDPLPGVERVVRHLHAHRVPIAVATSSHRKLFEIKTTRHGELFSLFDVIVTGDDPEVGRGKPAPDIFLLAAARLNTQPTDALVFEDAPSGLAAGLAAGMQVVAIPDPHMDMDRYRDATVVLKSMQDFKPREFGLPGYSSDQ